MNVTKPTNVLQFINPHIEIEDNKIIGLTKQEIKHKLGQVFNDMNSDVWMYRINENFSLLRKNYLYIYFNEEIAVHFVLKKFRSTSIKKKFLINTLYNNLL